MRHGSLFSGIGGFDLAAERVGWTNVFHCEFEVYKRKKLEQNFTGVISYGDIRETDFTKHRGAIDVLTGGFPCQDASNAKQDGKGQQGLQGERTGLFFEMCRAIEEIKPTYIVAENVSNLLRVNRGKDFGQILAELARMGYNAEWRICHASEVGSPQKRTRLYIIAYPNRIRLQKGETFFSYVSTTLTPFTWRPYGTTIQISRAGAWETEPPVLCLDDGVSPQLVRESIHGYGNAIIPHIVEAIFRRINYYDYHNQARKGIYSFETQKN